MEPLPRMVVHGAAVFRITAGCAALLSAWLAPRPRRRGAFYQGLGSRESALPLAILDDIEARLEAAK
ncbi:MAG: hypothetical protein ABI193_07675 [Minicystis sp.]